MTGVLRRSFLVPWVLVSAVAHALIFLGVGGGVGLLARHGMESGDGFGGQSIEVEIAGPIDGEAHGATQPTSARAMPEVAPPPPAAEREEAVEDADGEVPVEASAPAAPQAATPERERPPRPPADPGPAVLPGASETTAVDDPSATVETSPGADRDPAGTGGDATLAGPPAGDIAGLILGSAGLGGTSVTPRTALLPNGGVCTDPVVGTWRAQKYRTADQTWVRFLLAIRRGAGGELSGTITSRIWTGNRSDPTPPACTAFGMDHTWRMNARGRLDGEQLVFRSAGGARLIRQDCPRSDATYAPDHFTGRVEPMREVFESVNNDGHYDVDEPYTFRRVSCE